MLMAAGQGAAEPVSGAFVYCSVPSISPRGQGIIVTSIFRSRSEPDFIRTVFANYLRTSYAPYGNGWVFQEPSVSCTAFRDRRMAEIQRGQDIGQVARAAQSIFNVSFQLG